MHLGVHADVLARRTMTGVDYYTRGLLRAAAPLLLDDTIELCYFGRLDDDLGVTGPNVRRAPCPAAAALPYKVLDRYLVAPPLDLLCRAHPDVFLFPDFVCLPLARCHRRAVIIYDTAFADLPDLFRPQHRRHLQRRAVAAARVADRVIAISEFTKRRVCDLAGVPADKVVVIPPGVDLERFHPVDPETIAGARLRYGLPERYILFLGTLTGRKNASGLIAAYRRLGAGMRDTALVLVGRPGWQDDGLEDALRQPGTGQIVRLGYVPEADLPALYAGAAIFAYPSLYEGFGMPILEAMAAGIPVITSATTSLPEAAGDAAVLVAPTSVDDLAAALESVLTDDALAASLVERGLARAASAGWEPAGRRLAELVGALRP